MLQKLLQKIVREVVFLRAKIAARLNSKKV